MKPTWMSLLMGVALVGMVVGCSGGGSSTGEAEQLRRDNELLRQRLAQQERGRQGDVRPVVMQGQPVRRQAAPEPRPAAPAQPPAKVAGLETTLSADRKELTVLLPGDVLFASGSVELKPSSQATLDKLVAALKKDYPNRPIRVEGHTDTDPIDKSRSQWLDNLDLSQNRAGVVARYLVEKGISPKQITTVGHGEKFPKASKAASRRVEIVVLLG
jgi:outer membrane protein OmpA-like peptidoglycan-associated protein